MAAGATYTPIATTTASGSTSSVTFSSIPSTYTDLILVIIGGTTTSGADMYIQLNSDTGNNYSRTNLYGNGTSAGSTSSAYANQNHFGMGDTASFSTTNGAFNSILHFNNYSNTTTYKSIIQRSNLASAGTDSMVALWRSTSAINTIYIYNSPSRNFLSGSTFTLYGITAA